MSVIEVIEGELIRLHEMYAGCDFPMEKEAIRNLIDKLHAALIKAALEVKK